MEKIAPQEEIDQIVKTLQNAINECVSMTDKLPKEEVREFTALFLILCGFNQKEMEQIVSNNENLIWLFTNENNTH